MEQEQDSTSFGEVSNGWQARLQIANGDKSKVGWPQLKEEDIRCMQDAEERSRNAEKCRKVSEQLRQKEDELCEDKLLPVLEEDEDDEMVTRGGENFREISWIWTVARTAGTDEELEDGTHPTISEKTMIHSNIVYSAVY
jgi:hypothetical protein